MMYTKGYVNQEMTVSQRAYPGATRPKPHVWWPASEKLHSTRRRAPPQHTGMESWPRTTMTADATPSVQLLLTVSSAGSPITRISSMRRSGAVRIVDIPIGIIERRTGEANRVVARLRVEL